MTDHGTQFFSNGKDGNPGDPNVFQRFLHENGAKHILARVKHPQTKGYAANCITSDTSEQTFLWVGSDPASLFFHFHLTGICEPGSS